MAGIRSIRRFRKALIIIASILVLLIITAVILADQILEPALRKRLQALIVNGSDSLYRYQLGDLNVHFLGGSVVVENLQVTVDSNRYEYLRKRNALPALTMELKLEKGNIKGINLVAALFGKLRIGEIASENADVKLSRHVRPGDDKDSSMPLWKALRPSISSIGVDRIRFDGVKLLYQDADTAASVQLQFDRCDALFEDLRIDSLATVDTSRIGFSKNVQLRLHDLNYRTADSVYKMGAAEITYSSKDKLLELDSFHLEPTLPKEEVYKLSAVQTTFYVMQVPKLRFQNLLIDRFVHHNIIQADSLVLLDGKLTTYLDRGLPRPFDSKVGQYPSQLLLTAPMPISIKGLRAGNGQFSYAEKNPVTRGEGTIYCSAIDFRAGNLTNEPERIKANPLLVFDASGKMLGSSPFNVRFAFRLDTTNGLYNIRGTIRELNEGQLDPVSRPLANVELNSFHIRLLEFNVDGEDFQASAQLRMLYENLALTVRKADSETGDITEMTFLTKVLNRRVIAPSNPGPDGIERTARGARATRLSTQSFFGLFWKALFAGMQDIMLKDM